MHRNYRPLLLLLPLPPLLLQVVVMVPWLRAVLGEFQRAEELKRWQQLRLQQRRQQQEHT